MGKRKADKSRSLHPAEKVDIAVADAVALKPKGLPGKAFASFAEMGDQPPMLGVSAGVLASGLIFRERGTAVAGVRMLAALGIATLVKTFFKNRIDRTRPHETIEKDHYRLSQGESRDGDLRSMPSGHSAGVVAVARAAARDYPSAAVPLGAGAATIAAAQLPSRNHFLTDVIAGTAIGLVSEAVASMAVDRLLNRARP